MMTTEDQSPNDIDAGEQQLDAAINPALATVDAEVAKLVEIRLSEIGKPTPAPVDQEDSIDDLGDPAPQFNATQNYAVTSDRSTGTPDVIAIPPASEAVIRERLDKAPNVDFLRSGNQLKWGDVIRASLNNLPMDSMYSPRMAEEGSDFQQRLSYNNQDLRGRAPSFKKQPGTREVEGERALIQMVAHLGVGGLFRAPLWNSGIWVTFKPATETELLELNHLLYSDKIQLGRWSYGLALSNSVVYTIDRVFEFALQHVYNTSVKSDEMSIQDLRKWIKPQDINSFIWGFLCANYPAGFHYQTACIEDPAKCTHVIEANLALPKLQWVDNTPLSDWQRQHMASMSPNSKTLDSIRRYQEEMARTHARRVVINQGTKHELAFTLHTPTIMEYIDQGHRWIGNLVENVNTVLGLDATDKDRNNKISQLAQATALRQYTHWVESIEYGDLSVTDGADEPSVSVIKDLQTIEDTLNTWSSIDSIREAVMAEIKAYINHSTLAVIGVPAYDCPACKKPQEGEQLFPRHTDVIALDVLQVFFGLLAQRLTRIAER